MDFRDSVVVVAVGPMDGFQKESIFSPTGDKIGQMEVTSLALQGWRQRTWKETRRR